MADNQAVANKGPAAKRYRLLRLNRPGFVLNGTHTLRRTTRTKRDTHSQARTKRDKRTKRDTHSQANGDTY